MRFWAKTNLFADEQIRSCGTDGFDMNGRLLTLVNCAANGRFEPLSAKLTMSRIEQFDWCSEFGQVAPLGLQVVSVE